MYQIEGNFARSKPTISRVYRHLIVYLPGDGRSLCCPNNAGLGKFDFSRKTKAI